MSKRKGWTMSEPEKEYDNISIFVSSTFLDMRAERDALRYSVLPKINQFAEQYGCAVEIIDLRWGVDTASISKDAKDLKVLGTCLKEIKRCRPFFLGLIGDRYGWTPQRVDVERALNDKEISGDAENTLNKIDTAKFLDENPDISVTALEIEYGVLRLLNSAEKPPICLFYFRKNPEASAIADQDERVKFLQTYQDDDKDKVKRDAKKEKLEKLKNTIKDAIRVKFGQDVEEYPSKFVENWKLTVPDDWVDMVVKDINAKLKEEWGPPPKTPPDWRILERKTQKAFRKSRERFAGRELAKKKMIDFCLGEKATPRLLIIQGEAGSGKSGFLCKVMDEIEKKCLLLPFSCGISSDSNFVKKMLQYFIFLLREGLKLEDDSETITKLQDLKDRFKVYLNIANERKIRVVAVVDALDQLVGGDEVRQTLLWASKQLPENFRMLCSIIDGPETKTIIDAIEQPNGEIQPISIYHEDNEAVEILDSIARQRVTIYPAIKKLILKKQKAATNPLYLSLVVQDIAMMNHYNLNKYGKDKNDANYDAAIIELTLERINKTLGDNPESAYLAILDRLEELCREHINPDFDVRMVCNLIAVSRGGLREHDLEGALKILGKGFDSADFSWLRYILPGHITQGDMKQWNFSHQSMRRALMNKMSKEKQKQLHNGIVDYFLYIRAKDNDNFAIREIIHHLCGANKPNDAVLVIAVYSDYGGNRYAALKQGLADVYTEHEDGPEFLLNVLKSAKNVEEETLRLIMAIFPEYLNAKKADEAIRRLIMAIILDVSPLLPENASDFRIKLMCDALAIIENIDDIVIREIRAIGEMDVAELYTEIGNIKTAHGYYKKVLDLALQICDERNATPEALNRLVWAYNGMANSLRKLGDMDEAGKCYQEAINIIERIDDPSKNTAIVYSNMGLLISLDKNKDVREYFQKAIDAGTRTYERTGTALALGDLVTSYYNMGELLEKLGDSKEAGRCYQEAIKAGEQAIEQIYTPSALRDLVRVYDKMGHHKVNVGDMDDADAYFQKALVLGKKICAWTDNTITSLRDLSHLYNSIYVYQHRLGEKKEKDGDHQEALIIKKKAGKYLQKALDLREQIYDQDKTSIDTLVDLAVVYHNVGEHMREISGNMEEASKYYEKALTAREQIYKKTNTPTAHEKLTTSYNIIVNHLMMNLGKLYEAEEYYQRAESFGVQIDRRIAMILLPRCMSMLCNDEGDLLMKSGDIEKAGKCYKEAIDAMEQVYENIGLIGNMFLFRELVVPYNNMGNYLTMLRQPKDANEYYQRAINVAEQFYKQTGEMEALVHLPMLYNNIFNNLMRLDKPEDANEYSKKTLITMLMFYYDKWNSFKVSGQMEEAGNCYRNLINVIVSIYEQIGTMLAFRDLMEEMWGHFEALNKTKDDVWRYYQESLNVIKRIQM